MVDTGDDATFGSATNENGDESRLRTGEIISFAISILSSPGNSVTFAGFTNLNVSQTGSFSTATGIFTGADRTGTGGRVNELEFGLNIVAIPEASSVALLAIGGVVLAGMRRRTSRRQ